MLKRLTGHPLARRLAVREYLPMGAWIATWAMLGLALGPADTVRLLAANTFVQAARSLTALELTVALKARLGGSAEILKASRRKAFQIDAAVLLASAVLAGLFAWFLDRRGMNVAAVMVLLIAIGLPARHPGGVLIAARERVTSWRLGAAVVGLIGAAAVWLLRLDWWWAAVLFGLRDWGGLLATAALGPRRAASEDGPAPQAMSFREVAGRTESTARRRLTYRISKSVLGAILGPFGSLAARTGRGANLDHKLSRYIPRHRGGFLIFTAGTLAVALALLLASTEPVMLLLAAAATRISASGASALLWWNYAAPSADDEDDDD